MALQPAPSALRTVEIVRFLADHPGQVFAVAELARRVGQSRTTCQSVLQALEPSQWVHRSKDGYSLGSGLIAIGAAAQGGAAVVSLLRASARDLHNRIGCEILGYLPAGDRLVNVIRVGSLLPLSTTMVEGQTFPLAPPYGLAFAAWNEQDLEQWIARAPGLGKARTARLRRAAKMVRELGYSVMLDPVTRLQFRSAVDGLSAKRRQLIATALDYDDMVGADFEGLNVMRVSLLSGPVFGPDATVCALIGVVFDATEYHRLAEMADALKAECRDLSSRLGAPVPGTGAGRPA